MINQIVLTPELATGRDGGVVAPSTMNVHLLAVGDGTFLTTMGSLCINRIECRLCQ